MSKPKRTFSPILTSTCAALRLRGLGVTKPEDGKMVLDNQSYFVAKERYWKRRG